MVRQGLSIGDIHVDFPVMLAPLAGYSDLAFRGICREHGAPYCTTEMMLDRCVTTGRGQQAILLATDENDHPIAGQLIGSDPQTMADAARALEARGFDAVDLNFACPVNKALRRRRGGYLMSRPRQVVEIARAVISATSRPVTLKVRQKFAHADDESAFWHLAEGALDAGAAAITVHARSVEQKYAGPADWDFLRRVRERFAEAVVIGSGDVLTPQAALDMLDRTGVDGVVVGRGVLGNPWFFRHVRDLAAGRKPVPPSLYEQRRVILEHFRRAVDLYGPKKGPRIMRKFGIKYARMHPHPKQVRMAFVEVKTPRQWQAVVEEYYPIDSIEKGVSYV